MSLKMKHEDENVVSLDNEQIRSIIKTQSEAGFQDKNISNNSNFVKKSLIEIALDFESKQEKENNLPNDHESIISDEINTNELKNETVDASDKNENEPLIENMDAKDILSEDKVDDGIDIDNSNSSKDITIEAKGKITLKGSKGIDVDGGSKMTIKAGAVEIN